MLRTAIVSSLNRVGSANSCRLAKKNISQLLLTKRHNSTTMGDNTKRIDSIIKYWFGNEEKALQWRIWFPRKEDQPVVDKYE